MIKLIAVDLDDTLLNSEVRISEENKKIIQACLDQGIHFTFATGRMFRSAVDFAKEVGISLPLITYQGALVKTIDNEEIHHHVIQEEVAKDLIDFLKNYDMQLNVYMNDTLYMEKMNDFGEDYVRISRIDHEITSFPQGLHTEPTKVLLAGRPELLNEVQEETRNRYKDILAITKSKDYFLEFGNPKAMKGIALKNLADSLGIKREEVMAIGDGMNDFDMLQYAGLGVAVENAVAQVKEVADFVTSTNDQDGVAKAIKKFVL